VLKSDRMIGQCVICPECLESSNYWSLIVPTLESISDQWPVE